jgi:hypothetical protein
VRSVEVVEGFDDENMEERNATRHGDATRHPYIESAVNLLRIKSLKSKKKSHRSDPNEGEHGSARTKQTITSPPDRKDTVN